MNTLSSGACIFFTGLSGAGKTTIANALDQSLRNDHSRTTTLLDGDVVRTHLSTELGFSRRDRDCNIARIGFVATEIVKHGGIVIVAAIAPFDTARRGVRAQVEQHGVFLMVHLSTALSVCEARDPKGLYVKARHGEIAAFTGISDPYEVPDDADLTIDTAVTDVADAVRALTDLMSARCVLAG